MKLGLLPRLLSMAEHLHTNLHSAVIHGNQRAITPFDRTKRSTPH